MPYISPACTAKIFGIPKKEIAIADSLAAMTLRGCNSLPPLHELRFEHSSSTLPNCIALQIVLDWPRPQAPLLPLLAPKCLKNLMPPRDGPKPLPTPRSLGFGRSNLEQGPCLTMNGQSSRDFLRFRAPITKTNHPNPNPLLRIAGTPAPSSVAGCRVCSRVGDRWLGSPG